MITITDCRSDEGVTVGLIDAMIAIARVLAKQDLSPKAVKEALKDLHYDEDIDKIFWKASDVIVEENTRSFSQ